MTKSEALKIVGRQNRTCLRNMAFALTLHSWNNSEADWQRFEAACLVLGRGTPARARDTLKAHRAAGKRPALPNAFMG